MKIAYLASRVTLPDVPHRREDAFEHDQTVSALHDPFGDAGLELCPVAWDDPRANWTEYAAALIGTTWDYWDRQNEFLDTLQYIESQTRLFNPTELVRWNSDKTYLRELENRGADLIPTVWLDRPDTTSVRAAFRRLETDDLVLKRQIGAGAHGQHRVREDSPVPSMTKPMMAQPFLSTIEEEGEFSFVFVDGQLSHALLKRPGKGDYRVQSLYGGSEECHEPSWPDRAAAESVLAFLDVTPLYARVDMVRSNEGALLLMELELIEPFLYPLQGPDLGPRMAAAVSRRISAR